MFSGYEVVPMTAGGDICALHDADGKQVAMGTREVCETLLYLVTNSPLMERPRDTRVRIPRQGGGPMRAPASRRADSDAGVNRDRGTSRRAEPTGGTAALYVHAPQGKLEGRPASTIEDTGTESPTEDVLDLPPLSSAVIFKPVTDSPVVQPSGRPPGCDGRKQRVAGPPAPPAPYGVLTGNYLNTQMSSFRYAGLLVSLALSVITLASFVLWKL